MRYTLRHSNWCGTCNTGTWWQPMPSGKQERCETCGTKFPCTNQNCGHGDCDDDRVRLAQEEDDDMARAKTTGKGKGKGKTAKANGAAKAKPANGAKGEARGISAFTAFKKELTDTHMVYKCSKAGCNFAHKQPRGEAPAIAMAARGKAAVRKHQAEKHA